jgi:acyl carrier protein
MPARRGAAAPGGIHLDEVKRVLRRLIEENAGIPAAEIRDDSTVDTDLALDSMSFIAVQVAVEEEFDITWTPEEIQAANRFDAIAALAHAHIVRERSAAAAKPRRTSTNLRATRRDRSPAARTQHLRR